MSKTSSESAPGPARIALNGPTMGTRWSALFHAEPGFDREPVARAMRAAVEAVDAEMSLWRPQSALNRANAAAPGIWIELPAGLTEVLETALEVGQASGGAFEIGMGDAVAAWGFGPDAADAGRIAAALRQQRRPSWQDLELDVAERRLRKHAPLTLDLNGIAKGYGVDRLALAAREAGLAGALLSIDGELYALGSRPDGSPWPVAVEAPRHGARAAQSVLEIADLAVATSGDYRHWVEVGGARLSHTMDPARGGPVTGGPASVTVLARDCMRADAWATALMVLGPDRGADMVRAQGLSALFLDRAADGVAARALGPAFERSAAVSAWTEAPLPA